MTSSIPRHLLFCTVLLLGAALLEGCSCVDEDEYIWRFEEPYDDVGPDAEELPGEEDWDWAFPDPEIEPEAPQWEETSWETVEFEERLPRHYADNFRTSLVVDRQGTVWLGYHRCADMICSDPELVVGHRRVGESQWTWESIEYHSGLFGLKVIEAGRPIVIYLDGMSRELRTAKRQNDGRWRIEALPVQDADPFDGFDVSRDRARYYVSHASHDRRRIEFFTYNTASSAPYWRRLQPRDSARSAAFERGLRAGNNLNFFLVHQDNANSYRLSEYDLGRDEWTRSSQSYPGAISSLLVRQNGEICTAGAGSSSLRVTCGSFEEPLQRIDALHNGSVYYLSSMIENRAQTLFVAYHDALGQELFIARKPSHESWSIEQVHEGETFGISTAIDHRDHLLMSFYFCQAGSCALRLLERAP